VRVLAGALLALALLDVLEVALVITLRATGVPLTAVPTSRTATSRVPTPFGWRSSDATAPVSSIGTLSAS
jgi:hypothetical protein